MRTVVTFRSAAFNTTERRPHFINDGCYGDDVARWLIGELRARGIPSDPEPGPEDFGWYVTFRANGTWHRFVITYRPGAASEPGDWIGRMERKTGIMGWVVGGSGRGIAPAALRTIHQVLQTSERVSAVRWHHERDFDAGNEAAAGSGPD